MASWPAGHRIEDYNFKLLDKSFGWLADITPSRPRGKCTLYGQFGGELTFELDQDDPWASELKEHETHFIAVYRDSTLIFSGHQIKLDRVDQTNKGKKQPFEFSFVPLSRMAQWRHGVPVTGTTLEASGMKVDDGFKWIVERTLGATAPATPTTALARAVTGFVVSANKTEHPTTVTLNATGANIYEFLETRGSGYTVDWDIYFDSSFAPTFQTWYPRRGLDRTEANGVNTECIFTDADGSIVRHKYGWDASDLVTVVVSGPLDADVASDTASRSSWLIRETVIPGAQTDSLQTELDTRQLKEYFTLEKFTEKEDKQWLTDFNIGDSVTWKSNSLGYGPTNDIICEIAWEIDEKGFEHLDLTFGDPEPDARDNMRGGGRRRNRPDYSSPSLAGVHNVLSTTHGDTLVAGVSRGSVIYGNATPAWAELTVGAASAHLESDGADVAWQANITMADGATIGQAAGPLITFDDTNNHLEITGCKVAIGVVEAARDLHIRSSAPGIALDCIDQSRWQLESNVDGTFSIDQWGTGDRVTIDTGGNVSIVAGDLLLPSAKGIIHADSVAAGKLLIADGTRYIPADLSSISGHAILSTTHTDSLAAAVSRGSIIYGNATPKWGELTVGAANTHLESDGTDVAWVLPDIYGTPATCTVSTGNVAGIAHTHAITSSSDPGASAKILASDASGYLELVRLQITAATYYVNAATNYLQLNGVTGVRFGAGGTFKLLYQDGVLLGSANNAMALGANGVRFSNVWCSAVNVAGNITVTGTVDGVDVSTHTHPVGTTVTWGSFTDLAHVHYILEMCTGWMIPNNSDHYHIIPSGTYLTGAATTTLNHRHQYYKADTPTGAPS